MSETAGAGGDQLGELRAEVERTSTLPVGERLAAFEAVNASIARHLAALDEL